MGEKASQTRNYRVVAMTMDDHVLEMTKLVAKDHGVSVSGLVNLALRRLLEGKDRASVSRVLERAELGKRRRTP